MNKSIKILLGIFFLLLIILGVNIIRKHSVYKQKNGDNSQQTTLSSDNDNVSAKILRDTTLPSIFGLQFGMSIREVQNVFASYINLSKRYTGHAVKDGFDLKIDGNPVVFLTSYSDSNLKEDILSEIRKWNHYENLNDTKIKQILKSKEFQKELWLQRKYCSPFYSAQVFMLDDNALDFRMGVDLYFCSKGLSAIYLPFNRETNVYKDALVKKYGEPKVVQNDEWADEYLFSSDSCFYYRWTPEKNYEIMLHPETGYPDTPEGTCIVYRYIPFEKMRLQENREKIGTFQTRNDKRVRTEKRKNTKRVRQIIMQVYFYTIKTGKFKATQKLTLIK